MTRRDKRYCCDSCRNAAAVRRHCWDQEDGEAEAQGKQRKGQAKAKKKRRSLRKPKT